MYLIEFIIKKWFTKKQAERPFSNPADNEDDLYKNCDNHLYMAIDSTCEFLACKNCGHILRNTKNKKNKDFHDKANNF